MLLIDEGNVDKNRSTMAMPQEVDIVKVDVEGAEWGALELALTQGIFKMGLIKQFLIEWHFPPWQSAPYEEERYLRIVNGLRDQGMAYWNIEGARKWTNEASYMYVGKDSVDAGSQVFS